MVKLSKIYTRSGDDGSTGLVGGDRVSKASLRVEAYGSVDEANASVGLAIGAADDGSAVHAALTAIQHDLFDLGADLATPMRDGEAAGECLRITPAQTERLERLIDEHNGKLEPLTSFVLPAGTELAARLHLARTVTRRAERVTVALAAESPDATSPETVKYLNRLSDLLFVLARCANLGAGGDVLWTPGANRGEG